MFNNPKNQNNRLNSSIVGKYPNIFRIFGLYGDEEPENMENDLFMMDIDNFFLDQLNTKFFFQIFKRKKPQKKQISIMHVESHKKIIVGISIIGSKMFIFK